MASSPWAALPPIMPGVGPSPLPRRGGSSSTDSGSQPSSQAFSMSTESELSEATQQPFASSGWTRSQAVPSTVLEVGDLSSGSPSGASEAFTASSLDSSFRQHDSRQLDELSRLKSSSDTSRHVLAESVDETMTPVVESLAATAAAAVEDTGRDMLDPTNPDNPRWAFRELLDQVAPPPTTSSAPSRAAHIPESKSPAAEDPMQRAAAAKTALHDKAFGATADETEFYSELKPYRNVRWFTPVDSVCVHGVTQYFMLSRVTPLAYHASVTAKVGSEDVEVHFAGVDVDSMRAEPSLKLGPCCSACEAPQVLAEQPAPAGLHAQVEQLFRKLNPAATSVDVQYKGHYRQLGVTEFLVQTESGRSVADDLTEELTAQRDAIQAGSGVSDMDRMDLDLMLSMLGPSSSSMGSAPAAAAQGRRAGRRAAAPAAPRANPGMRAVVVATTHLVLDASNRVMNDDAGRNHVTVEVASLSQLKPKRSSYYLDYCPPAPGAMVLCSGDTYQMSALTESAIAAAQAIGSRTYRTPWRKLDLTYGSGLLPAGYRERRRLTFRVNPISDNPEDVEPGVETKLDCEPFSLTMDVSIHDAYYAGTHSTSVTLGSTGAEASLTVSLRGKPSVVLKVRDVAGQSHTVSQQVVGTIRAADGAVSLSGGGGGLLLSPLVIKRIAGTTRTGSGVRYWRFESTGCTSY